MDKISILIPVYNREKYIFQTIEAAINQTYKNIEVIIVDNQSTDNTWSIIKDLVKTDSRIKIFQNDKNIGPVKNWKRCINEATGVYGKILWSDDLISPLFLEKTYPYIRENKTIGFVFTGTEIFYPESSKKFNSYYIGNTGVYSSEQFIKGIISDDNYPLSPGCALFRISDLKQNLLINIPNKIGSDFSMLAIGNDLLIFLLTAHQYPKFAFINEKLSFFRAHEESISNKASDNLLSLHYDIAKAYFVENYRKDLTVNLNASIWADLRTKINLIGSNEYTLSDFYINNRNFKVPLYWRINYIFKEKARYLQYYLY